jgi:hypothetical protein
MISRIRTTGLPFGQLPCYESGTYRELVTDLEDALSNLVHFHIPSTHKTKF